MPGMNTLTHIVYCICNQLEPDNSNITGSEQYEAQLNELLKEEDIVKKLVFKTALDFVKEEEHKEYIRYIFRSLSTSANILEDAINNAAHDIDSSVVLLQQQALLVVKRLTAFFLAGFPDAKAKNHPVTVEMFKLPISVAMMAALTKGVIKATNVPDGMAAAVIRFIIRHFSSINTNQIAYSSFRKQYDKPEANARHEIILILESVIRYLKKD
jgi:hypothetical protein